MMTGGNYFLSVFLYLFGVIRLLLEKQGKSHHGIHRRAYIMRHICKEIAFRLVGAFGNLQSVGKGLIHASFFASV